MNLNHLMYFVTVADRGSFSAAASALFITPQGISKAIAELEQELGNQLFERKNRGVVLTEFGKSFYQHAKLVQQSVNALQIFSSSYQDTSPHAPILNISVCVPPFDGFDQICESLTSFIRSHIRLNASVSYEEPAECIPELRKGAIDAAITLGKAELPDIDTVPLGTVPCGLQIDGTHPLAGKTYIRLSDLDSVPVALMPGHDHFNDEMERQLAEKECALEIRRDFASQEDLHRFMKRGGGLFVPRFAVLDRAANEPDASVPVTFHPDEGLHATVCLLIPTGKHSEKVQALLRFLGANHSLVQSEMSQRL